MKKIRLLYGIAAILCLVECYFLFIQERIELNVNTETVIQEYQKEFMASKAQASYCKGLVCKDISDAIEIETNLDINTIGTYTIQYKVQYETMSLEKEKTVLVRVSTDPILELIGSTEVILCPNEQYQEEGYLAVDNNDNSILTKVKKEYMGNKIFYKLTSESGKEITATRTIYYKDEKSPTIELRKGNYTLYKGDTYEELGYTVTDNCSSEEKIAVSIEGSVDTNTIGDYEIIYTIKDEAGNTSTASRIVTVKETKELFDSKNVEDYQKDIETYITTNHYKISVGFYNIETGYTYTYNPETKYYACSQVKAIDAMYAWEKTDKPDDVVNLVKNMIEHSTNYQHEVLVKRFGINNLRDYARNTIGMKLYLTNSDTDIYAFTNVSDQLTLWKYMNQYFNSQEDDTLKEYFIGKVSNWLKFDGAPFMVHKPGYCAGYRNESGIIYADSPYIVVILSYEANYPKSFPYLSERIYEMNELLIKE